MRSDAELVAAVLAGETSAYGELYDRYARLVRAICCDATGEPAEAQDLAQEIFLSAYRNLRRLNEPQSFPRWLVVIARRAGRQWKRRQMRDRHRFVDVEPPAPPADSAAANDGELRRLSEAMLRLPAKERLAVRAFYLLDQSAEQAREALGLSRSGFYKVLDRAKGRLRKLMETQREGIE